MPCQYDKNKINLDSFYLKWTIHTISVFAIATIFYIVRIDYQFSYTADDSFFNYLRLPLSGLSIGNGVNGRFIAAAFLDAASTLGIAFSSVLVVTKTLSTLSFATFAYVFTLLIGSAAALWVRLVAGTVIVLHPYNTTNFDNRINQPNEMIAFIAITIAITIYAKCSTIWRYSICTLLLIVAAASYQTSTYYFVVFIIAYALISIEEPEKYLHRLSDGVTITVLALVIYLFLHKFFLPDAIEALNHSAEPLLQLIFANTRSSINDVAMIAQRSVGYIGNVVGNFIVSEIIFPAWSKAIVATILGLPLIVWFYQLNEPNVPTPTKRRWKIFLIFCLLLMCSSPIHILLDSDALPARSVMHTSAVMSAIFLFGWQVSTKTHRGIILAASPVLVLVLAFQTHSLAFDRHRLLDRDRKLFEKIASEVAQLPTYTPDAKISVVGNLPKNSIHMRGIKRQHDINVSKFHATWSVIPMLSKAIGRRLEIADRAYEPRAQRLCLDKSPLENLYLLIQDGENIVLCLEDTSFSLREAFQ